ASGGVYPRRDKPGGSPNLMRSERANSSFIVSGPTQSLRIPPPGPLPEAERGEELASASPPRSGEGAGGGVLEPPLIHRIRGGRGDTCPPGGTGSGAPTAGRVADRGWSLDRRHRPHW